MRSSTPITRVVFCIDLRIDRRALILKFLINFKGVCEIDPILKTAHEKWQESDLKWEKPISTFINN
jgi:hypothetical protein